MKEAILPIKSEGLITNRYVNKCYPDIERLIVGRENIDEIRSYININFNASLKKVNIIKIELSLYLEEIDLKNESDCFMLSIGTVFSNSPKDEISWNNSPKFYQESLLYKIKDKDKKKYIRFDITSVYKKYIAKDKVPVGFILLCFNANAIVSFASIKTNKKGFITVYYSDNRVDEKNNNIEINKSNNEKNYGQFYSKEAKVIKEGAVWTVLIDNEINNKGIALDGKGGYICFSNPGIYRIEYSINCRCNDISTMALILSGNVFKPSIIQVGSNEGVTTGHCIVNVANKGDSLKLGIYGDNVLTLDIGVAANITIVEI